MPRNPPKLGHVTLRLDPAIHQELLDLGRIVGNDMSGLIRAAVIETLPALRLKAAKLLARRKAADREMTEVLARLGGGTH